MINKNQKQPYRDVLKKKCSKYMQKIYRKTAMSKCNVNKVALQLIENAFWQECSPADLLHIFRTLFYKNSYERGPPMWFLLVLWFDITHQERYTRRGQKHTQRLIEWHTRIKIYEHHLLCAYNNYLYYTEWIICWYQKFTFQNSKEFQKHYSFVEVTYLLIRFT